ncbi:MAG: class I SAM-dependent methyltransferase [Gammaproteobacteria bacterium]|nr:class I SAM-dependent methyltransferase [Gammaproteobacteria bacterium]
MGIYDKYVLPKLIHFVCGLKPNMRQREKVLPLAHGRVLEIGVGSGLNLAFYDARKVEHLFALDPSAESWSIAEPSAHRMKFTVDFVEAPAESIPLERASVDSIIVTYSLCTIPEVDQAVREMHRVLRKGGELIFCEHGLAPDQKVRNWQDRLNPFWRPMTGGCNLNRDIPSIISAGGFEIRRMETMYLPGPKPLTFKYWGVAH